MKKLPPIGRAGMDVDAGRRMRELADDARDERRAEFIERMRQPVMHDGIDAGKAEQHLLRAFRRRIALEGSAHVGRQDFPDARQPFRELAHDLERLGVAAGSVAAGRDPD